MIQHKQRAIDFRSLHHSKHILVLPNAWDVASARVFEEAGFPAVATSSGGVAVALGYRDGQNISRREMLDAVARIARVLTVPLSADMEAGYGSTEQEIEEMTNGVISAGAVGMNIEDSTGNREKPLTDIEEQVRRLKVIRRTADSMDFPIFINARTDAFLHVSNDRIGEVIRRANSYKQAGADCIYTFGVLDPQSIAKLVESVDHPINIRAGRGSPTISELERLGVARASLATGPVCAALGYLKKVAMEIHDSGTYSNLLACSISYDELNKLATPKET
ncbi:MAG: isocitrate lyase/PEP mutase family protein [Nitrososphaerales archaeon]